MSVTSTDLTPFNLGVNEVKMRAQALRLVRHLFRDIEPALATLVADWVLTGIASGDLKLVASRRPDAANQDAQ